VVGTQVSGRAEAHPSSRNLNIHKSEEINE